VPLPAPFATQSNSSGHGRSAAKGMRTIIKARASIGMISRGLTLAVFIEGARVDSDGETWRGTDDHRPNRHRQPESRPGVRRPPSSPGDDAVMAATVTNIIMSTICAGLWTRKS